MPINAKAKLTDKEGLTSSIVRYHFELIEPTEMNFAPGQYIILSVGGDKESRNYSIASSPLKSNKKFQIIVDLSPQGKGAQFIEMLEINSVVSFIGEVGEFVLPEALMPNLVFVSTGTGIAPIKSMVESIILNREDFDVDMFVYAGARSSDQVVLPELFTQYLKEKHIDDYRVYINEEETENEYSEKGEVSRFIERLSPEVLTNANYFLCGSGLMIEEAQDILKQKGVPTELVIYERHY